MIKNTFLLFAFFISITAFAQQTIPEGSTELVYGRKDGMALTMYKLQPEKKAKGKAIISLVSGNWISNFSMLESYTNASRIYADNGYTVFMVMHSSQPRYSIADEAADIKRAVRFIRYNAKMLGIDSMHIGITGSSSGGHLSLLTALVNDTLNVRAKDPVDRVSGRVQAAAVFFPPTDFLNWGAKNSGIRNGNLAAFGVAGAFDFKTLSKATGMYEHITDSIEIAKIGMQLSPIDQVSSDDPPIMITHGDKDQVVPLQQSETILEKLKVNGVKTNFILHPGGGHGWQDNDVEKKEFVKWFDKWL